MERIQDGTSPETAFIIQDSHGEYTPSMRAIIENLYGHEDNSYFIHGESTLESKEHNKRYKVLFLEDSKGIKRNVYFEVM